MTHKILSKYSKLTQSYRDSQNWKRLTNRSLSLISGCYIRNWKLNENQGLLHTSNYFTVKRVIDNFDYVNWIY